MDIEELKQELADEEAGAQALYIGRCSCVLTGCRDMRAGEAEDRDSALVHEVKMAMYMYELSQQVTQSACLCCSVVHGWRGCICQLCCACACAVIERMPAPPSRACVEAHQRVRPFDDFALLQDVAEQSKFGGGQVALSSWLANKKLTKVGVIHSYTFSRGTCEPVFADLFRRSVFRS